MTLEQKIRRAVKLLPYKVELIILPKWKNLIEYGNKNLEVKNVFNKIQNTLEKEHGVKFGDGGFGFIKWAIEVKQGAEKIPDAFITKGGARFIIQNGLFWSDLQKTFFAELGFQEKVFGGYGGPEPFLWMETTKAKFNLESGEFEQGGVLRFSWNQEKEICTFPLNSIRLFDAVTGERVRSSEDYQNLLMKNGFNFSTDLGYEIYENEYFIIKFKEL